MDLLRAEGYAVDWVRDGEMADTALLSQNYDLLILDLMMPWMTGDRAFSEMRRICPWIRAFASLLCHAASGCSLTVSSNWRSNRPSAREGATSVRSPNPDGSESAQVLMDIAMVS